MDEILYVLDGELTVIEEGGPHTLGRGDAAIWPAGVPDAHAAENRGELPCSYLRIRTTPARDVIHSPEIGYRIETGPGKARAIREAPGKAPESREGVMTPITKLG